MVKCGGGVAAHHLHLGLEEMEVMGGGQVVMEVQVICIHLHLRLDEVEAKIYNRCRCKAGGFRGTGG